MFSATGPNGVAIEVRDETGTYGYADVHHLRLRVEMRIPGQAEPQGRLIERIGVRGEDLERCRREVLDSFRRTLPYVFREDFPLRYQLALERRAGGLSVAGFGGSR